MSAPALLPILRGKLTYTFRWGMGVKLDFDVKWRRIETTFGWDGRRREGLFFPRFGVRLTMPEGSEEMRYFGYGPGESYADKRLAARLGLYASTVTENYEPYVFPQENSSHWGCRFADVHTVAGHGFLFYADAPFSFTASHYSPEQLTEKRHHYELEREAETTVILDCRQSGIGSNSCGPALDEKYRFSEDETVCSVVLKPVFSGDTDPFRESRVEW